MKSILVIGTTFAFPRPLYGGLRRTAGMVGRTLARTGFGLITGNAPGVDSVVAAAFWEECKRLNRAPEDMYQQLWLPHWRRGYWMPGRGFSAPASCIRRLETTDAWMERAIDLASAGIMIGGRSGSFSIASRFMDAGKQVLPIPFVGGVSRNIFEKILLNWSDAPMPGLSQAQFLRLAVPWNIDTGPLANLLLGTLAETHDIFISYRRSDSATAVGRLHSDLVDHFGDRRVFFDLEGIVPSAQWKQAIEQAIDACRVGLVVIGPQFLARDQAGRVRLHDRDDVLRHELLQLIARKKTILPVLIGGAQLPGLEDLPDELRPLLSFQTPSLDNVNWASTLRLMIEAIERALGQPPAPTSARSTP